MRLPIYYTGKMGHMLMKGDIDELVSFLVKKPTLLLHLNSY